MYSIHETLRSIATTYAVQPPIQTPVGNEQGVVTNEKNAKVAWGGFFVFLSSPLYMYIQ